MLFNSHAFLFVFLPLVLAVYHLLRRTRRDHPARIWLVVASLYFYAWWSPVYLWLLLFSIGFNYSMARALEPRPGGRRAGGALLGLAVAVNLGLLGYFKYANFFVHTINDAIGTSFHLDTIVLPLAISFFTFQQIAYVVDTHRGITREHRFLEYCLFVTFFPQLIAGPIVHHKDMLPQFARRLSSEAFVRSLAVGTTVFVIGLFKKVVVADGIAVYATPVFDAALEGATPTTADAWVGALAYTFQLYFDFSGYSDMAIGLGWMFGIRLPLNFDSPYKAANIIEFWRRWHMTLSRFLRDYLYIPLGGNRRGSTRRYVNLMITMLLGGLWHGAAWTFAFWGALHGLYLVANHGWQAQCRRLGLERRIRGGRLAARALTFVAVAVAWVFFRAEDFPAAWRILEAMVPPGGEGLAGSSATLDAVLWIGVLLLAVNLLPNAQELVARELPTTGAATPEAPAPLARWIVWRPTPAYALPLVVLAAFIIMRLSHVSEFLYYQF